MIYATRQAELTPQAGLASRSIAESVVRPLSEGGIREVGAWHGAREIAFRDAWWHSCIRSMAYEIMSTEYPGQLRRPGNGGLAGGRQDLAAGSPKAASEDVVEASTTSSGRRTHSNHQNMLQQPYGLDGFCGRERHNHQDTT